MNDKYLTSIDEFFKEHPELDPSLKPVVEPLFRESKDQLFSFIMSSIFM